MQVKRPNETNIRGCNVPCSVEGYDANTTERCNLSARFLEHPASSRLDSDVPVEDIECADTKSYETIPVVTPNGIVAIAHKNGVQQSNSTTGVTDSIRTIAIEYASDDISTIQGDEILQVQPNQIIGVAKSSSSSRRRTRAMRAGAASSPVRPSFISVRIFQQSTEEKFGLEVEERLLDNGNDESHHSSSSRVTHRDDRTSSDRSCGLVISSIDPDGLLASISLLHVGQDLISIDGHSCDDLSPTMLKYYLQAKNRPKHDDDEESSSFTDMVVEDLTGDPNYVCAVVVKKNPLDVCGIQITGRRGRLSIGKIHEEGAFGHNSVLLAGNRLVSINGEPTTGMTADMAAALIRTSSILTISTKLNRRTGVVLCEGGHRGRSIYPARSSSLDGRSRRSSSAAGSSSFISEREIMDPATTKKEKREMIVVCSFWVTLIVLIFTMFRLFL